MLRIVLAAGAALILATPSLAQTDADARLAAAERTMALSGGADMGRQMMAMMMPSIEPALRAQYGSATDAQIAEAMALVEQTLNDLFPGIIEESARAYADVFTLEELEQINAFYETDTGRKLVETMPQLMDRVGRISSFLYVYASVRGIAVHRGTSRLGFQFTGSGEHGIPDLFCGKPLGREAPEKTVFGIVYTFFLRGLAAGGLTIGVTKHDRTVKIFEFPTPLNE